MNHAMSTHHLSAGYEGTHVFEDFNIEIPAGKITTLVGANGSGKSTILKTMARLLAPDQGTVYLEGASIYSMPTKSVAKKLALLPQSAQIPEGLTVQELAEYGRFPYRNRFSSLTQKDTDIIHWALQSTNMLELSKRELDQLSGGQRQRAWIAMALAQKTNILFLDEPTTFLDISHQLEILQLLKTLNTEHGVTVVMVLHDLNHAIMFSDYLVAIKDGATCYDGPPEALARPDILREVFNVKAAIMQHPALSTPVCLPYASYGNS